ncbi:unnamed protein product [Sphenostylis stenocarpa]|uniref:Uncharacterized protein n=1 Tax=Sphenostylis stenocarpa TaxID=92480 RepID=A0AA86VPH4_9FABA|nr:unnamed protein product [Sphenostylis stenocarpa]
MKEAMFVCFPFHALRCYSSQNTTHLYLSLYTLENHQGTKVGSKTRILWVG